MFMAHKTETGFRVGLTRCVKLTRLMDIKEGQRGTGNTLVAMEPKLDAKDSPPIHTGSWSHNTCHTQSAKAKVLCSAAIAKSNNEDHRFQRTMAIGAIVDI